MPEKLGVGQRQSSSTVLYPSALLFLDLRWTALRRRNEGEGTGGALHAFRVAIVVNRGGVRWCNCAMPVVEVMAAAGLGKSLNSFRTAGKLAGGDSPDEKFLLSCLVFTGLSAMAHAQSAPAKELSDLQGQRARAVADIDKRYAASLEPLLKKAMAAGDLDLAVKIREEMAKFGAAPSTQAGMPMQSTMAIGDAMRALTANLRGCLKTKSPASNYRNYSCTF
jgi:hypothetical protein